MPQVLKPYFWDVNFDALNVNKDKEFIITRLLELGRVECAKWVFGAYDKSTVLNTIDSKHNLSEKTCNLVRALLS